MGIPISLYLGSTQLRSANHNYCQLIPTALNVIQAMQAESLCEGGHRWTHNRGGDRVGVDCYLMAAYTMEDMPTRCDDGRILMLSFFYLHK